jgi:hypothetical protein
LDFCLQAKFWPGFILALGHCGPETRWLQLTKIFELGNVENITSLGYLSTEENCSRLIEMYLTESEKREKVVEVTLEQIAFEMIESIGIENSMRILIQKSPKFKKRTFSSRYLKKFILN